MFSLYLFQPWSENFVLIENLYFKSFLNLFLDTETEKK